MKAENEKKKEIKEFIKGLYYKNVEVENLKMILVELRHIKNGIDDNYNNIIKDIESKINYNNEMNKINENKNIEKYYKGLTANEKNILFYRHHDKMVWDEITNKMHYSMRTCLNLYKSALMKVGENIEKYTEKE